MQIAETPLPPLAVEAGERKRSQSARGIAVRLLGSVIFIWLALRGIHATSVATDLAHVNAAWLAAGLAVLAISFAISAQRWRLLAHHQHVEMNASEALRYTWIGLFFTNLLPGGFGGDAVRAWIVGKPISALSRVTASVIADRLLGAWALVGLGAVAVAFEFHQLPTITIVGSLLACGAVALGSIVLWEPRPLRLLSRLVARWPRVAEPLRRVANGLASYRHSPQLLTRAVAMSVAVQMCVVVAAYMLARSLGLHVGVGLLATCIPVALLATALPTTINGLGVREAVFRVLLVPAGVAPSRAVAFSLLTVIAAAIVSLPGVLAWIALLRRRQG